MKDHLGREISLELIKESKDSNIKTLQITAKEFGNNERKILKVLISAFIVCAIALYWFFYDLLGRTGGFVVFIAIISIVVLVVNKLGISFANKSISVGKLSYKACKSMETLVGIKLGTYSPLGDNISMVGQGKHQELYLKFSQLYPELANKKLQKLANIEITYSDIFD